MLCPACVAQTAKLPFEALLTDQELVRVCERCFESRTTLDMSTALSFHSPPFRACSRKKVSVVILGQKGFSRSAYAPMAKAFASRGFSVATCDLPKQGSLFRQAELSVDSCVNVLTEAISNSLHKRVWLFGAGTGGYAVACALDRLPAFERCFLFACRDYDRAQSPDSRAKQRLRPLLIKTFARSDDVTRVRMKAERRIRKLRQTSPRSSLLSSVKACVPLWDEELSSSSDDENSSFERRNASCDDLLSEAVWGPGMFATITSENEAQLKKRARDVWKRNVGADSRVEHLIFPPQFMASRSFRRVGPIALPELFVERIVGEYEEDVEVPTTPSRSVTFM